MSTPAQPTSVGWRVIRENDAHFVCLRNWSKAMEHYAERLALSASAAALAGENQAAVTLLSIRNEVLAMATSFRVLQFTLPLQPERTAFDFFGESLADIKVRELIQEGGRQWGVALGTTSRRTAENFVKRSRTAVRNKDVRRYRLPIDRR